MSTKVRKTRRKKFSPKVEFRGRNGRAMVCGDRCPATRRESFMMNPKKRRLLLIGIASLALVVSFIASQLPSWGAGALLHPWRRRVHQPPPANCEDAVFAGSGVTLKGWRGSAPSHEKRGTIICLHGVAD